MKPPVASLLLIVLAQTVGAQEVSTEGTAFFESKIRPVLISECYGCHSSQAGNIRGGLRLDTKEMALQGGSSGPAVVPGDVESSLLLNAIKHEDFVMPPKRKLSDEVVEDFRKWIEMGAPDPRDTTIAEIKSSIREEDIRRAKEEFWAYQPPVFHDPPIVKDQTWPDNAIDHFILARLEASNLRPAADAQPRQLIRRLSFDLLGLPPSPAQIESFCLTWKQNPREAIDQAVEQMLGQQQFGERWGRHWLDVARYAESTGREVNMTFPHAWRYRDYVIESFNEDKPYNQFVQEQIAGDLLPAETDEQWARNLVATTFLAIGPKNVNEQSRLQFEADLIDEQIDATTRVFLGTSVACARCHDHKFDAIPQTDYYALAGIFSNATTYFGNPPSEYGSFASAQVRRTSSLLLLPIEDSNPFDRRLDADELSQLRSELEQKMRELADGRRQAAASGNGAQTAIRNRIRLSNEMAQLSGRLAVVDERGEPRSYCMGVQERSAPPRNVRLLVRGEIDEPAQEVERGFPQVLCQFNESIDAASSGRLELATWIGSDRNPLAARVMVNRIWQQLLGQGLVASTDNFGVSGQAPSHPELLDYLATRFIDSNWSVKSVIREIMQSRVYRINSEFDETSHQADPDNALLWRANPRRLDAEAVRDSLLMVSGEIDLQRPRASEVAKAGYQRVVGGSLGDPRELARKAIESAGEAMRESMRERSQKGRDSSRLGLPGPATRGLGDANVLTRRPGNFAPRPGGPMRPAFGPGMIRGDASRMAMDQTIREAMRKASSQLDMEDAKFRSVYLPIVRDNEPRVLDVFDLADSSVVTGTRESSNTANQALFMLNNPFVIQQSEAFAERISKAESKLGDQIELAFVLAYGRPPTRQERSEAASFMNRFDSPRQGSSPNLESLAAFCQGLFASAEFRYLD